MRTTAVMFVVCFVIVQGLLREEPEGVLANGTNCCLKQGTLVYVYVLSRPKDRKIQCMQSRQDRGSGASTTVEVGD